jgi:hypothetical protein
VAVGYAFSSIANQAVGPFIAFCVGVFPLQTVQLILRRLADKNLSTESNIRDTPNQLGNLAGIDPSIADRIAETGVRSISQLAYCDPVNLAMATNLSFQFLNDMASQAIAWNYLEDKLEILRPFGLKTAYEINDFVTEYRSATESESGGEEKALLAILAKATKLPAEGLWNALQQIADDPYTEFLRSVLPANEI